MTCEVTNAGTVKAGQTRIKYYLSQDEDFDATDRYLNYDRVKSLEPGTTSDEDANRKIPSTTEDGTWYILFADIADDVAESNEDNNVVSRGITVGALEATGLPDLQLSLCKLVSKWSMPVILPISVVVGNGGDGAAAETELTYVLSRDIYLDEYDKNLSFDKIEPLGVGGIREEQADLRTPNTEGGDWYVLLLLDQDGQVDEQDETNNIEYVSVRINKDDPDADLADLVAADVQVSKLAAIAGEQIPVSLVVHNIGTQSAEKSRLRIIYRLMQISTGPMTI